MSDLFNLHVIRTDRAPAPVGPYNQAVVVPSSRDLLFLAGQIPLDPETGTLITGDIGNQTERVLENLQAVLRAAGTDLSAVVKTTVFLKDLADFNAMNDVYARYFTDPAPARSCVEVARLPRDVAIEIECVAMV
ncbi:MAG: RidA family protein [Oscillatoriales cyanobacterium SM2_2_1]|nr:RidA family protein [Oscillatoriales cyanobacterium SM2_2_1]